MTFVVTEKCIKCKLTDCVEACPVDCFHEGPNMLVINPDECIDCNLCVSQCPIDAIFEEDNLPNVLVTDPLANFYGVKVGQVVEITKTSETNGYTKSYRLCIR